MPYITLIAVIAILLLQYTGSIPQSSVGGPMTIALVFLVAALAVAIHEAWTKKRGVLGWIVNIVVVFIGVFVAAEILSLAMETMLMLVHFEGSVAGAPGLLPYVGLTVMMLFNLLGSWLALQVVNRWR